MEKMNVSAVNQKFLEEYSHVISYYVDCILQSRMMLDEDMHLMMTFWDPCLYKRRPTWNKFTLISSTCATFGTVLSLKLNNLYPFALSCIPAAVQISRSLKCRYMGNIYKNNFEILMSCICELYECNRSIIDYCHKRDTATQVFKNEAYTLLLKPGEELLKSSISTEIRVLEMLKTSMLKIFELVPVTEGEYIYSLEWNFDEFIKGDSDGFKDLQHHFQRLNDLYILVVSNFLSCLGLSFCFQLWKDTYCDFKSIFDCVIPELTSVFKACTNDIKAKFNNIRFTLQDKESETPKRVQYNLKSSKELLQLQKSLEDFLTNMQVIFETGKHLQLCIEECDENSKLANHSQIVEDISSQLVVCEDSLDTFFRLYYLLTKQSIKKEVSTLSPLSSNDKVKITKEIRYDDPEELLEDEEYNLSIHGSDDEEIIPFIEYADQFSTEYLELMLHELKTKLKERKGNRDEPDNNRNLPKQKHSDEMNIKSATNSQPETFNKLPVELRSPPLPPPLPFESSNDFSPASIFAPVTIGQLPAANNAQLGFLDAVKSVAQSLNRDEEFQFGFNMFPEIPRPFNTTYSCFSVAMLPGNERQDVERGGKIIMPPSALEQLTRLNINYPMLFKITNKKTNRITHCGVLEFVADEGKVYLPLWMMHNLVLEEGNLIQIESVSLPVGKFAKFQPLSPDFLDITNPKAVLENCLRTFACLTSGDVIAVKYNQRVYELCVLETQPGNAISIIECDMNVEFAPPVGYKESEEVKNPEEEMVVDPADLMPEPSGFVAFRGTGNRLDGKRRKDSGSSETSPLKPVYVRGIPDYDYEIGTLRFLRHITKSVESNKEENGEFKAFSGEGFSLKRRN